jgi:hypothetical protein
VLENSGFSTDDIHINRWFRQRAIQADNTVVGKRIEGGIKKRRSERETEGKKVGELTKLYQIDI